RARIDDVDIGTAIVAVLKTCCTTPAHTGGHRMRCGHGLGAGRTWHFYAAVLRAHSPCCSTSSRLTDIAHLLHLVASYRRASNTRGKNGCPEEHHYGQVS